MISYFISTKSQLIKSVKISPVSTQEHGLCRCHRLRIRRPRDHNFISWLFLDKLKFGVIVAVVTLDFSWWVAVAVQFGYVMWGGCPDSRKAFSFEAFYELREFVKLSAASGVTRWFVCPF